MCAWLKAWQRNRARRPFPPLYEAVEKFGANSIDFKPPRYEVKNQCPWCGKEVNNKRRRYCSDTCRDLFAWHTVWKRGRDSYSTRILYRDNFTCQDCKAFHAYKNEHGMYIPVSDGELEVHHIVPVCEGGGDEPDNLITLCKECHLKRHGKRAKHHE